MNLLSIGISHHTAPVELRERMWLSEEETREAVKRFKEKYFSECMIVSTCNRTELYGMTPTLQVDDGPVRRELIDFKAAGKLVRPEHFQGTFSGGAVHHLFKVAAGIDSMVIGDVQILNQVKEAFNISRDQNALGPVMNRLLQSALRVGKRTRTETAISDGAVSVSYAAVELAGKIFEDLSKKSALMIGAGKTGELTVKHLAAKRIGSLSIANRTREKAEALVKQLGGSVIDFDAYHELLATVDIVITSISSPVYIIEPETMLKAMKQRGNSPLFIIDIGVPRNVNPAVKRIESVFLYDIDSLNSIVDANLERRKAEIPKVTTIIREEMVEFFHWYNSLDVGPTITDFRETLETIRRAEVEKNINRFKPEDRELVEMLTRRIVNKILHQPMTVLKQGAENGHKGNETLLRVKALRELFGIKNERDQQDEHS
jgi:glutamyl-tRNA reductase